MSKTLTRLLNQYLLNDICSIVISYSYKHITQYATTDWDTDEHYPRWTRPKHLYCHQFVKHKDSFLLVRLIDMRLVCCEIKEEDLEDVTDYVFHNVHGYPELDVY